MMRLPALRSELRVIVIYRQTMSHLFPPIQPTQTQINFPFQTVTVDSTGHLAPPIQTSAGLCQRLAPSRRAARP